MNQNKPVLARARRRREQEETRRRGRGDEPRQASGRDPRKRKKRTINSRERGEKPASVRINTLERYERATHADFYVCTRAHSPPASFFRARSWPRVKLYRRYADGQKKERVDDRFRAGSETRSLETCVKTKACIVLLAWEMKELTEKENRFWNDTRCELLQNSRRDFSFSLSLCVRIHVLSRVKWSREPSVQIAGCCLLRRGG